MYLLNKLLIDSYNTPAYVLVPSGKRIKGKTPRLVFLVIFEPLYVSVGLSIFASIFLSATQSRLTGI